MIKVKLGFILILLLIGPVIVSGADEYQLIAGDLILQVTKSYILSESPWDENDVQVEFKDEMADVPVYLNGKVDLEVEKYGEPGLADVNMLKVRIDIAGVPYARINVGQYISIKMPIVVSTRDIEDGKVLDSGDVEIKSIDLTEKHINDPMTDINAALGLEAKQPIRAGEPVKPRLLEKPLMVKRGQDISAIIVGTGFQITLNAQALDNGREGESIRIKNRDSGDIITAWVIADGVVEVRI